MDIITNIINEIWVLFREMAPYLIFGFLIAGLLHVLMPDKTIARHFRSGNIVSVFKASVFGIPLPLCSCGVIPVAAHLRKQGAGQGPTLSFLISTPTTGVDSILATYGVMGPLLAVARPVAALINGMIAGVLANWLPAEERPALANIDQTAKAAPTGFRQKARQVLKYAFVDLIADVAKWLLIGIVVGGLISYLIPNAWIETFANHRWLAYFVMLLIGIPMYVCATGSIPIAASLMLKGLSPGAAFVFLFAGPATNTATVSFVGGKMGSRPLAIYLITIFVGGLLSGLALDMIWDWSGQNPALTGGSMEMVPGWLSYGSAIVLAGLLINVFLPRKKAVEIADAETVSVSDMNCEHCKSTLESALCALPEVDQVNIDLPGKLISVSGNATKEQIAEAIQSAGYSPSFEALK